MKKLIVLLIICLSTAFHATGQNVSFDYDADGNMTSRYTVTLRSSQQEETAPQTPDNTTIALDGRRITVSPNPTRGEIFVNISPLDSKEENFLQVFDLSGRLIETRRIESERTRVEIRGSAGVYLINIHLGAIASKWKIIKQ
jgi:YD repeat-containing protein